MDSAEVFETLIRLVSNEISIAEAHSLITGEVKQAEKTSIAVCPRCGNSVINLSQGTYCLNSECEYQEEK